MPKDMSHLAKGYELKPDVFPCQRDIGTGMFYRFVPVADSALEPAEFVYVPGDRLEWSLAVAEWNSFWEAGRLRQKILSESLPTQFTGHPFGPTVAREMRDTLATFPDTNLVLIHMAGRNRYPAYAPLHHLLPLGTLRRFGLPPLKRGIWPPLIDFARGRDEHMPIDYEARLGRAVLFHLWPLLSPGTSIDLSDQNEPLRLLAHSLDYWMPYADVYIRKRIRERGRVQFEKGATSRQLARLQKRLPEGLSLERPLFGGVTWGGEEEAWDATKAIVETADSRGRLRVIIDAMRSHSIKDNFSPQWSAERERFERGLYDRRNKIKVSFVELPDTIPVHGYDSQVIEDLVWQSLMAILNQGEGQVVICLRNGKTEASDMSKILGYSDEKAVSKELARIRRRVGRLLGVSGDRPARRSRRETARAKAFERDCRVHQYHEQKKTVTITGKIPRAGQNLVHFEAQDIVLGDADLVLFLALLSELKKGQGGRIGVADLQREGHLPQGEDQAVLRLRKPFSPFTDSKELIKRPGDKTIRLSIHPSLVTVDLESLSQHPDARIRSLVSCLANTLKREPHEVI